MMQVIKFGGSILTQKNADTPTPRMEDIIRIGETLRVYVQAYPANRLAVVHGAGGFGHAIAAKHQLVTGAFDDVQKDAALRCQQSVAALHMLVMNAWQDLGVPVVSVPTHDVVVQRCGRIHSVHMEPIHTILSDKSIPVLCGDIVPDTEWNYSVCSGDAVAAYLSHAISASRLLFATDIDGVCTKDPHMYEDAELLCDVSIGDIMHHTIPGISSAHTTDVTGGLYGKLQSFVDIMQDSRVEEVVIFNGLQKNWLLPALDGSLDVCTRIQAERTV
jgi:isopentenyl phosphate kinase